ncbi:hypothetical protein [Saccharothrix sp. HUAS TT1]|uniref:hypothetical protein n=1 Tax=unclassified Saccharothrix TaxID=2593673 RepID=UPI00345BEE51
MTGYSDYQPHGETLSFANDRLDDSVGLFSRALQVRRSLADVVRPCGDNLWLTCVIDDTWINVSDPEPSEPHWQVVERGSEVNHVPPAPEHTVRTVPELSENALLDVFGEALGTVTCPSDFFVTFEQLTPTAMMTRVVDESGIGPDGTVPVRIYEREVRCSTTRLDGVLWIDPPAAGSPFLPPVTFTVRFDGVLMTTISVHWSRWLDKGTGEHRALQSALDSLKGLGWRARGSSYRFAL